MVTTTKKTTSRNGKISNNGKSRVNHVQTQIQQAQTLTKKIRNNLYSHYKVKIATRNTRISTKVGHAVREKLGLDIQAQLNKYGNGKKFDWQEWNNKIFPKLFGKPDALKIDVEVVALMMSLLYDTISEDTQSAINDLIEFNAKSLARRNGFVKDAEQNELNEIDDEEDEFDDEDEEINDLLDEIDDEEDFELDDEFEEDED